MKVLSTEQIREADQYTIRNEPVLSVDLMERAANALTSCLMEWMKPGQAVRIFAGSGNNGGDGIAMARLLSREGIKVTLHILGKPESLSADARVNYHRLGTVAPDSVKWLETASDLPEIQSGEILVDAIFGSGLNREPEGIQAAAIDHMNRSGNPIVAVDIPSGLFGDDNRSNRFNHVIRAALTLTLEVPKICLMLPELGMYTGSWKIVPIGLHPGFLQTMETPWHLTTAEDCRSWVKSRSRFDHKGTFGHALLIAGSHGKTGAAILALKGCLRSGAGLTTACVPSDSLPLVQVAVPEAMAIADPDPVCWTRVPDLTGFSAIGIGPGLGRNPLTGQALSKLVQSAQVPVVLDADALNLMSENYATLSQLPAMSILTPHPGEFTRLFGQDPNGLTRLEKLKNLAVGTGLVLVLKGAQTAVAGPDGTVWFNSTGNPGMATGGTGDVLAGLITGLLARGYEPLTAARLGVYLHGRAGDLAARIWGPEAMTAGDLIGQIGIAFKEIQSE